MHETGNAPELDHNLWNQKQRDMLLTNKVEGCLDNYCFVVIPRNGIPDQSFIPNTPRNSVCDKVIEQWKTKATLFYTCPLGIKRHQNVENVGRGLCVQNHYLQRTIASKKGIVILR